MTVDPWIHDGDEYFQKPDGIPVSAGGFHRARKGAETGFVEDLVQDVFIRIFQNSPTIQARSQSNTG